MSIYDMIDQFRADRSEEKEQRDAEKQCPILKMKDGDKAKIRFVNDEPTILYYEQNRWPEPNTRYHTYSEAPTGKGMKRPALTVEYLIVITEFTMSQSKIDWMKKQSAINLSEGKAPLDPAKTVENMKGKVFRLVLKGDQVFSIKDKHDERAGLKQHQWSYKRRGKDASDTVYELEYWGTPDIKKDTELKAAQKLEMPNLDELIFGASDRAAAKAVTAQKVKDENSSFADSGSADDDEAAPF